MCGLSAAWYKPMLAHGAGVHISSYTVRLTCCMCCLQGEVAASPGSYAEQPVTAAATKGKPKKGRAAPKGGGKAAGKRKRGKAAAAEPEPEAAQALVSSEPAAGADAVMGEAGAAGRLSAAESHVAQPGLAGSAGPTPDGGNAAELPGREVNAGEQQPETLPVPEAAAGPSGRKGRAGPGKAASSRSKQRGRKPSAVEERGPESDLAAQAAASGEVTDADGPAGAQVPAALPGARRSGRRRPPAPAPEEPAEQATPDGTRRSSRRGGPAAAGQAGGTLSGGAAAAELEEQPVKEAAAGGPSGVPTDPEVGTAVGMSLLAA